MKNLLSLLLLCVAFPLVGMAQNEVDIPATPVSPVEIEDDDEIALIESIDNKWKEQAAGYEIPELTGDVATDKATLDELATKMFSNPRLRSETPAAVLMLAFSGEQGVPYGQEMFTFFPTYYRIIYGAATEYYIYSALGGQNENIFELTGWLMENSWFESIEELEELNPEEYKAVYDSISSFIKRLDWLGDIYPGENLLPREAQDSIVQEYVDTYNFVKTNIDQRVALRNFIYKLQSELYQGKDIVLENYFTPEVCEKIRQKKMNLSDIAPDRSWKDWNPQTYCSYAEMSNDLYAVSLNEEFEEDETGQNVELHGVPGRTTRYPLKEFYIEIDRTKTPLLISDFLSSKAYCERTGLAE